MSDEMKPTKRRLAAYARAERVMDGISRLAIEAKSNAQWVDQLGADHDAIEGALTAGFEGQAFAAEVEKLQARAERAEASVALLLAELHTTICRNECSHCYSARALIAEVEARLGEGSSESPTARALRLGALVRRVEWAASMEQDPVCPWCRTPKGTDHDDDCPAFSAPGVLRGGA